jgi:hypothetical protein
MKLIAMRSLTRESWGSSTKFNLYLTICFMYIDLAKYLTTSHFSDLITDRARIVRWLMTFQHAPL